MDTHNNAPLKPKGREVMVRSVAALERHGTAWQYQRPKWRQFAAAHANALLRSGKFVQFFGYKIAIGLVVIATPVPMIDGRWCPVGLQPARWLTSRSDAGRARLFAPRWHDHAARHRGCFCRRVGTGDADAGTPVEAPSVSDFIVDLALAARGADAMHLLV